MSLNWERALLGTVLAEPNLMVSAESVLPSDFTGAHGLMWAEMLSLHQRGSLGPRALIEGLRTSGALNQVAFDDADVRGERYVTDLVRYRGEEIDEYVTQVMSASTKRELMTVAALIRSEAADERTPIDELLDSAEQRIMSLRRVGTLEGVDGDRLANIFDDRQRQIDSGEYRPAWTSKISRIANVMGFAEKEDYIIWAARPGQGKSSVLRTEFYFGATGICQDEDGGYYYSDQRVPSLLINMENSLIEIARAGIAMITGINKDRLKAGTRLSDNERQAIRDALGTIRNSPQYIVSRGAPTGKEIKAIARKFIHEKGVSQIFVDYIQLMRNGGASNRNDDVSMSSSDLRSIALDFGVPVHAASQMNRAVEGRENPIPQLSDLRESGSLEQDATVVIFIHRPWRHPDAQDLAQFPENMLRGGGVIENAIPVVFKIAKNRNGRTGDALPVLFDKSTGRFRSVDVEL